MYYPMSYRQEELETSIKPRLRAAKELHRQEKEIGMRSIELIGKFEDE